MDVEAHERGETLAPDGDVPLPDRALGGAASLLPDETRPAVVQTMDVDATGEEAQSRRPVTRAESRELDYVSAQQALDGGTAEELRLLREVGILRLRRGASRRRGPAARTG